MKKVCAVVFGVVFVVVLMGGFAFAQEKKMPRDVKIIHSLPACLHLHF